MLFRLTNLLIHLINPFLGKRNQFNKQKHSILYPINFLMWIVLIPFKIIEIVGFSYGLNYIFNLFTKTRPLTDFETNELKLVFKDSINYSKVRINENSKWAKAGRKLINAKQLGFVFMNTINFTQPINCKSNKEDMFWLVHEMVHISQFKALGIQYVFEALVAQNIGGYNYGNNLKNNPNLSFYNLEQQADIIKHYYITLKAQKNTQLFQTSVLDLLFMRF